MPCGGERAPEHVGGVQLRLPDGHPFLADRGAGGTEPVTRTTLVPWSRSMRQRVRRAGRAGRRGVDQLDHAVRRDQIELRPAHRPSRRAGSRRSPYRSRSRCSGRASARRSGRCSRTARRPRPSCRRGGRGRSTCRRRSGRRRSAVTPACRELLGQCRRSPTRARSGRRTPSGRGCRAACRRGRVRSASTSVWKRYAGAERVHRGGRAEQLGVRRGQQPGRAVPVVQRLAGGRVADHQADLRPVEPRIVQQLSSCCCKAVACTAVGAATDCVTTPPTAAATAATAATIPLGKRLTRPSLNPGGNQQAESTPPTRPGPGIGAIEGKKRWEGCQSGESMEKCLLQVSAPT